MQENHNSNIGNTRENASASSLEDEKLVRLALSGGDKGYKLLLEKYDKPIYFHIRKMVRSEPQIEDLVQEVFAKVFSNLGSYNFEYAFSTWLYRIATNHTIDYLRKKKLKTMSIDVSIKSDDGEFEFQLPDEESEADRRIIRNERKEMVRNAIEELPDKYRTIIKLRHMKELSYDEISEELGLPLGTVKAHIFRARELLYKAMIDKKDHF